MLNYILNVFFRILIVICTFLIVCIFFLLLSPIGLIYYIFIDPLNDDSLLHNNTNDAIKTDDNN